MIPVKGAAVAFALLTAVAVAFQLALALGAPWGEFAMGGATPGVFPPALRLAALVQGGLLAAIAALVLGRAGLVPLGSQRILRPAAWIVVGLLGVSLFLNLITPSPMERAIWAPVVALLLALSLRVALSR